MRAIGGVLLWIGMCGLGLSACSIDHEALRTRGKVPDEQLKLDLYNAIWSDLQLDGLIGNGGWGIILTRSEATAHIRDIRCHSSPRRQTCAFDLLIEGGLERVEDVEVPERLRCTSKFSYRDEEWSVDHLPPRKGGGHSRTTLRCDPVKS